MQRHENELKKYDEYYYCSIVEDDSIPLISKRNIIIKMEGMNELARHYKEKYDIDIYPFSAIMDTAAEDIINLITKIKQEKEGLEKYRCGLIFLDLAAGKYGHASPLIYEKNGDQESLFFLDTGQFLGDTSYYDGSYDFVVSPSFSSDTDLHSLPGNSACAYVIASDNAYLVNKTLNKCCPVVPDFTCNLFGVRYKEEIIKNLKVFQTDIILKDNDYIELSDSELHRLRTIAKHSQQKRERKPQEFRNKLKNSMKNIELWSHVGYRQIDRTSCMTDALVILKDGLRLQPTFLVKAKQKFIKKEKDLNLFYMPEELLKTSQISSFVEEKSMADLGKTICYHYIKDIQGKKSGDSHAVTLKEFRNKYDILVNVHCEMKKFGTYALHKGIKYHEIIKNRLQIKEKIDMKNSLKVQSTQNIYAILNDDNKSGFYDKPVLVADRIESDNKTELCKNANVEVFKEHNFSNGNYANELVMFREKSKLPATNLLNKGDVTTCFNCNIF